MKAVFNGTMIDLQKVEMQIGAGRFTASGNYDRASSGFNLDLGGKSIPASLLVALVPNTASLPPIVGDVDFTAKATGVFDRPSTYNVNFNGSAAKRSGK